MCDVKVSPISWDITGGNAVLFVLTKGINPIPRSCMLVETVQEVRDFNKKKIPLGISCGNIWCRNNRCCALYSNIFVIFCIWFYKRVCTALKKIFADCVSIKGKEILAERSQMNYDTRHHNFYGLKTWSSTHSRLRIKKNTLDRM